MSGPIPVLVLACDRPGYLERTLSSIIRHDDEPGRSVIVSQHGSNREVASVVAGHGGVLRHLRFRDRVAPLRLFRNWHSPHLSFWAQRAWLGHHRVAHHYRWAFTQVFDRMALSRVIVLEDDMEIAPDFFDYFRACVPLLDRDSTLLTVSAWNDHGRPDQVSDPRALHRTECFPGLGWLMTRRLWATLKESWPEVLWDDWLRDWAAARGLATIYPEICRSYTFGEVGVNSGQYYERFLAPTRLNDTPIAFTPSDVSRLDRATYDAAIHASIARATLVSGEECLSIDGAGDVKIPYHGEAGYLALAAQFGLIPEFRNGVPRASYQGVVTLRQKGRRVFLVPLAYLTARGQLPTR